MIGHFFRAGECSRAAVPLCESLFYFWVGFGSLLQPPQPELGRQVRRVLGDYLRGRLCNALEIFCVLPRDFLGSPLLRFSSKALHR
jgi:hypothetical protein